MLLLQAGVAAFVIQICHGWLLDWSTLASQYADPYTAQRDISANITIDQLTFSGISLNKAVFDIEGYSNLSLPIIQNYLDLKYSLFMVDLYWNHFTQKWQLCPAPIPASQTSDLFQTVAVSWNNETYSCMPGFSIADLFQNIESYLTTTNVRLEANMIQFALNLKSIYYEETDSPSHVSTYNSTNTTRVTHDSVPTAYQSYNSDYLNVGNSTLRDSLSLVNSYLFKPSDLESYNMQQDSGSSSVLYPTQETYLFSLYKRVFPFIMSNWLHNSTTGYNVSSMDLEYIFSPNESSFQVWLESHSNESLSQNISDTLSSPSDSSFHNWAERSHFRIVVDDDSHPFSNETIDTYLQSGFSTILNSSKAFSNYSELDQRMLAIANSYTPASFWSWAPGEFLDDSTWNTNATHPEKYANDDEWYLSVSSQTAYSCVSITKDGWALQNCYDKIRGACQNSSDPYSWKLTSDIETYLDWTSGEGCPVGFSFGVPHSSLEQYSLISHLVSTNVSYPVWIDINDITVPGCYVSGGPYALCPYQEAVSTKNFVKSLAPSSSVAIFLIILIFCERLFVTTPIHTNRKRHWKRKIADYYKQNDYEGVPL